MNKLHHPSMTVTALAILAAVGSSIATAMAEETVLKSSNTSHFGHWYGRAGGTVGSDRIEILNAATLPPPSVSVTYDKDVAARTNMQREGVENPDIAVTYDKDVAARTNMAREQPEPAAVAKSQK